MTAARKKTTASSIALVIAGVALVLVLPELYARAVWTDPQMPVAGILVEDDTLNHVLLKNLDVVHTEHPNIPPFSLKTNELGLRYETPYSITKPAGTLRVIFCGDSAVQGYEYKRTVPALVEKALAPMVRERTRGKKLEIIHAGVSSYSPLAHYLSLKNKLLALDPDLVIVAIDPTDARDDHNYGLLLSKDPEGRPKGIKSQMTAKLDALKEGMSRELPWWNSDRLIASTADTLDLSRGIFQSRAEEYAETYAALGRILGISSPSPPRLFDANDLQIRSWISESEGWVREINTLLRSRGKTSLLISMYPAKEQLLFPKYRQYIEVHRQNAEEAGIDFSDATSDFESYSNADALYLPNDSAYTYEGLRVWAGALSKWLEDNPAWMDER